MLDSARRPPTQDLAGQRRIHQLFENEIDLQTELSDLANEIAWRRTRLSAVLLLLRDTRREIACLCEEVA